MLLINTLAILLLLLGTVGAVMWCKRRSVLYGSAWALGAAAFVLLGRVLGPLVLSGAGVIWPPAESTSMYGPLASLLLVCLVSGVLEEGGKALCVGWTHQRGRLHHHWLIQFALAYALCELVLIGAIGHATLLMVATHANTQLLIEQADPQVAQLLAQQINHLSAWSGLYLLIERGAAVLLQVTLTLYVANRIQQNRWTALAMAMCVHAAFNIPAASYQAGWVSLVWVELFYVSCSALWLVSYLHLQKRPPTT